MSERLVGAEEGQALVIAALAMVVLMGALALTVDWGYGLAGRRAAQNEADAGALAAGRLLATSFVSVTRPFDQGRSTQEMVWTAACNAARRNSTGGPATQAHTLGVWFSADPPTTPFATLPGSTWTGVAASSDDCTKGPTGATPVNGDAVFVRVVASAAYRSLFGVPTQQRVDVAASARVRLTAAGSISGPVAVPLAPVGDSSVGLPGLGLSGSSTAPNVAIWPIVLHYSAADWTAAGSQITLIDWDRARTPQQADTSLFVGFAHFSPTEAVDPAGLQVHQIITESDYTASGPLTGPYGQRHGHPQTALLPSAPGACGGVSWDSRGFPDPTDAADCDIPNWFYYGYRGSLALGTPWDDISWTRTFEDTPQPVEMPDRFPGSRASCTTVSGYPFFTAPSCPDRSGSSHVGDWIETVKTGVDRVLVANEMLAFIDRYGRVVPTSGEKAVVVNVFLWDCGERFDGGSFTDPATRDRWHVVASGTDCSAVSGADLQSVDRVHLFTVVPVTISVSDVDLTQRRKPVTVFVTGHWGNAFGPAGICASSPTPAGCGLSPLENSAFLVPDA
jgi:Putative Flp pilus-assembly TadE/G-like